MKKKRTEVAGIYQRDIGGIPSLPTITGDDLILSNEGYSIGQGDKGESIVFLKLDAFTQKFLSLGMPSIMLKNTSYMQFSLPVLDFMKVRKLLSSFGLGSQYRIAFSILLLEVRAALRKNKRLRGDAEEVLKIVARFAKGDLPKTITIKYGKNDSHTLPPELIVTFWKAFLFDAEHTTAREKIETEMILEKIIGQISELLISQRRELIYELQILTGESNDPKGAIGVSKRIEKRITRQKEKATKRKNMGR